MASNPEVTIIVALPSDPQLALSALEGIAGQECAPSFEVIALAERERALEGLLASVQGDLKVIARERTQPLGDSLCQAIGQAAGRMIAILPQPALPEPRWLISLLHALADDRVGLAVSESVPESPADRDRPGAFAFAARGDDLRCLSLASTPAPLLLASVAVAACKGGRELRLVSASRIAPLGERSTGARRLPPESVELAIVIPTLDASSQRLRSCLKRLHAHTDVACEIIIIDNGAPPQGFTAPVNAAVRAAQAPYVVVMNDDVEVLSGWWAPLREALDRGASIACPLTIEGGMRDDFPAWCFAFARASLPTIAHAPGELFDPALVIWYQDTDLLQRLRAAGRAPAIVESSHIRHGLSRTLRTEDPLLQTWIHAQIASDRARFLAKHPDAKLAPAALGAV
jgi:hypothetical protein